MSRWSSSAGHTQGWAQRGRVLLPEGTQSSSPMPCCEGFHPRGVAFLTSLTTVTLHYCLKRVFADFPRSCLGHVCPSTSAVLSRRRPNYSNTEAKLSSIFETFVPCPSPFAASQGRRVAGPVGSWFCSLTFVQTFSPLSLAHLKTNLAWDMESGNVLGE